MRVLDESPVQPDEIDGLGHLNIGRYFVRAYRANQQIIALLGLTTDTLAATGAVIGCALSHSRFVREQREGAAIGMVGGVLEMGPASLRTYCEARTRETGEVAAVFIADLVLEDGGTRASRAWPRAAAGLAEPLRIQPPAQGRPRSLKLEAERAAVTFEALAAQLRDRPGDGWGVEEWTVPVEACDSFGYLAQGEALLHRAWRPRTVDGRGAETPVMLGADGRRFGWAVVEQRTTHHRHPRLGETLKSIRGVVAVNRKTRQTRRWIFDAADRLVAVDDIVALALDLDARRAIDIPQDLRADLERHRLAGAA